MKTLTIKCDGINSISTQYYSGEIEIELENIDLSFIFNLEPGEVARNCDLQKVLDYLDDDYLQQYVAERFNIIIE